MRRLLFALALSCPALSCESSDGGKTTSDKQTTYREAYQQGYSVGRKAAKNPDRPKLQSDSPNFTWGASPDFAKIRQHWERGFSDGVAGTSAKP
jgi:hypothetical protein